MNGVLGSKKRQESVETMGIAEALLVLSVRAFDIAVMTWGMGMNKFVVDSQLISSTLKERAPITRRV